MPAEDHICPYCGVTLTPRELKSGGKAVVCRVCQNKIRPDRKTGLPVKFVTIYVPRNESEHLAAQAILKGADIEFFSKNFRVQNLFGVGQIGTGFNIVTGPIQIQVPEEDAEEARELLENYFGVEEQEVDSDTVDLDIAEHEYFAERTAVFRLVSKAMLFCIFWFGGVGSILAIYYGIQALRLIGESDLNLAGRGWALAAIGLAVVEIIISPYLWYEILQQWKIF